MSASVGVLKVQEAFNLATRLSLLESDESASLVVIGSEPIGSKLMAE